MTTNTPREYWEWACSSEGQSARANNPEVKAEYWARELHAQKCEEQQLACAGWETHLPWARSMIRHE